MARRVLGAVAVTATAALATIVMATPASAHNPNWSARCDEDAKVTKVSIDLTQYASKGKNTVTLTDNGKELLKTTEFPESFHWKKNDLDAGVKHEFKIVVTAWDGFNKTDTKTVEPCAKKTPPTTTTKPVTTTTTTATPATTAPEVPSTSAEAPPSTTPAAPGGSAPEPPLAATGASPMWLLLSGLGLVGAGAGTLLFLRRRRSA